MPTDAMLDEDHSGSILGGTGSRTRAFRSARRHTILVRALRVLLPVATLAMLSSYGLTVGRSFKIGSGTVTTGPVSLSTEDLTMDNPRYQGFNKDGGKYLVQARTATQDLKRTGPIRLTTIEGTLEQAQQGKTYLKSPRGTFDDKASILNLAERVDIDGDNGLKVRMTEAALFLKEHRVVSNQPVTVEMPAGQVRGNAMVLLQATREVTFSNGAAARLKPQPRSPGQAAAGTTAGRAIGSSGEPVDVVSQTLYVDDNRKIAVFKGDVQARQGEATLTAPELEAHYDGQPVSLTGATAPPSSSGDNGRLTRIIARTDVVMTQGGDRVTCKLADFDAVNETAALTGGVVMTSAPDKQAIALRADLDSRKDTALLTGDVTVTQGRNVLKGQRLFVDRKAGTTDLASPAEGGRPAGRIFTRLYQSEASAAASAKKAPAAPAASGIMPGHQEGGFVFRTDPQAPIDIDADTLHSDDNKKAAIYRGKVKAVQGGFVIESDELVAFYTGSANVAAPGQKQPAQPQQQSAQLQKVKATKNVKVTSTNEQTATGDWADYDVKTNQVVLGGNVTVTQGKNVIHGPKLVIDMTTGLSHMETGKPSAWNASVAPPVSNGLPDVLGKDSLPKPSPAVINPAATGAGACPDHRACMVVFPSDANGKQAAPAKPQAQPAQQKPAAKAAPATSGWDSTTAVVQPRN